MPTIGGGYDFVWIGPVVDVRKMLAVRGGPKLGTGTLSGQRSTASTAP
jgi:hypothetical protein